MARHLSFISAVLLATSLSNAQVSTRPQGARPKPAHAESGDSTALVRGIDAILSEEIPAAGPGCAVGVSQDGSEMTVRAAGAANLELAVPIEGNTVFHAGSIAKQFTAAAILMLAHDGRLSMEDSVRRYARNVEFRRMPQEKKPSQQLIRCAPAVVG